MNGDEYRTEWKNRAEAIGLSFVADTRCPRTLAGHHCRGPLQCWCNCRLNDHGATWKTVGGDPLVLWEPYDIYAEELAEVAEFAAQDGLRMSLSGRSPWNPGATAAIVFRLPQ